MSARYQRGLSRALATSKACNSLLCQPGIRTTEHRRGVPNGNANNKCRNNTTFFWSLALPRSRQTVTSEACRRHVRPATPVRSGRNRSAAWEGRTITNDIVTLIEQYWGHQLTNGTVIPPGGNCIFPRQPRLYAIVPLDCRSIGRAVQSSMIAPSMS